MRQAVNLLQNANSIYRKKLEPKHVLEISGVIPETVLDQLWNSAKTHSFASVEKEVQLVMSLGYNTSFLLEQLLIRIIDSNEMNDVQKANVCLEVAKSDKCMADGADQYLQLLSIVSYMSKNIN